MFKEKTVFVLGAGSSHEFGMPLGAELKKRIASKLNFKGFDFDVPIGVGSDKVILSALRKEKYSGSVKTTGHFADAKDTYDTIDEFLASNPDDKEFQLCGKLGIVKCILDAEAKSCLAVKERHGELDYSFLKDGPGGTYLGPLIKHLKRGITINDFDELFNNVSFINFNYDRCLERGLTLGLEKSFPFESVPAGTFNQIVKKAKIIRPYGSVGSYWKDEDNHVPFGGWPNLNENNTANNLIKLVDGIKTYSEENSEIDIVKLIQEEIFTAQNIVFLGFHFYDQNLKLLSPGAHFDDPYKSPKTQTIFATVYQRSDPDKERLKNIFKNFAHRKNPNNIVLEKGTCYDLFNNNQLAF